MEVLTIYLLAIMEEDNRHVSRIHRHAAKYLPSWLLVLPTYKAYVHRRLADCLPLDCLPLLADCPCRRVREGILLLDSMPIVTCWHKRAGQVAPNLSGKGLCPSKNLFYYGCKLHSVNDSPPAPMPLPVYVELTAASEHDLTVMT